MFGQHLNFLLKILLNLSGNVLRKRKNIVDSLHEKAKHLGRYLLVYTCVFFEIHFGCFSGHCRKYLLGEIFESLEVPLLIILFCALKWHILHHSHYVLLIDYSIKVEIVPLYINKISLKSENNLHIEGKSEHLINITYEYRLEISYKCSRVDTLFIKLDELPFLL